MSRIKSPKEFRRTEKNADSFQNLLGKNDFFLCLPVGPNWAAGKTRTVEGRRRKGREREEGRQYTTPPPPCEVRSLPFLFLLSSSPSVSAQIQIQVRSLLPQIDPSSDGPSLITTWLDWIGLDWISWWFPLPLLCCDSYTVQSRQAGRLMWMKSIIHMHLDT
jgi:hypothetical protein